MGLELEDLLSRDLEDPTRRTVMLGPLLGPRVGRIAQLDVFQMKIDARQPFVDQFCDAAIRGAHEGSRLI